MRKLLALLLPAALSVNALFAQLIPVGNLPQCVMLSIGADPATMACVTWRTAMEDTVSLAQIAIAQPVPKIKDHSKKVSGTHAQWDALEAYAMGHKVCFKGLQPSTKYHYRVGNGEQWSEWFQFETASDQTKPFSFLYFGDVQNDIRDLASRGIRQAYSHFPQSDFMLFAGDLVATNTREYWEEFFYAGSWIYATVPSVVVPGNHEYRGGGMASFSTQWDQIYAMPAKTVPSEKYLNRMYYFDYQGTRFIAVDGSMIDDKQDGAMLMKWLEKTLSSKPGKWCVLTIHQPMYPSSAARKDKDSFQGGLKALYEKYGVDLVLQGHDHVYRRGMNLANVGKGAANTPMYVVSVLGPKMYGLNPNLWSDRHASNTQFYQHIAIDNDRMTFETYDITGELYDAFTLEKQPGKPNKFTEDPRVKDIPMRINMPKDGEKKYSPEELERYHKMFSAQ